MKVEVKFVPSDEVFFMHENKLKHGFVRDCSISLSLLNKKSKPRYSIYRLYTVVFDHVQIIRVNGDILFRTKEELFEHLENVCNEEATHNDSE